MNSEGWEWTDADGMTWDFLDGGLLPTWGPRGLHGGPIRVARQVVSGRPGAQLLAVDHDVRDITIPVELECPDGEADFRDFVNQWAFRMSPARGLGKLRFRRTGGMVREASAICVGGFDFTESEESRTPGVQVTNLEFELYDLWEGPSTSKSWPVGSVTPGIWFDGATKGILPINLNPSTVIGESTVNVAGHLPAYPFWIIRGPGTSVTLTNNSYPVPRTLAWTGTIASGELLMIDAAGYNGVTNNSVPAFDGLTAWDFWPLKPGMNSLSLLVSGSTEGETLANASWRPKYLGP
jgi:Phage tail protein